MTAAWNRVKRWLAPVSEHHLHIMCGTSADRDALADLLD